MATDFGFEFLTSIGGEQSTVDQSVDLVAVRTKFLDDQLIHALGDGDDAIRQVVFPGVGGDSRTFRLDIPTDCVVFNIDLPAVIEFRRSILAKSKVESSSGEVHEIEFDLRKNDWPFALLEHGFDPTLPSCWMVEGLLMYLDEDEVKIFMATVQDLCAKGSRIFGDVLNHAMIHSPSMDQFYERWEQYGAAPKWGTDEPEEFFSQFHFEIKAIQFGEKEADYGRIPQAVISFLQEHPRESTPAIPRNFLFTGVKTEDSEMDWDKEELLHQAKVSLRTLSGIVNEELLIPFRMLMESFQLEK
eukprot:TRINITY_DN3393_c0_g1_i2.p1 TRINITY_DN3393_c0_g1~~TRINITY_DN3393_c0_g1_i2.p1  ORF type:complete len:337 (-),score=109.57 TRINITY_DN3393_c0_g1_i2:43-945(-)